MCVGNIPGYAAVFSDLNKDKSIRREIDCLSELSEYSDLAILRKDKLSNNVRVFAKKHGKDVFLKIYNDSTRPRNVGSELWNSEPLNIEGTIYNNHIKYLLEKKITPNLVEGVDFFMCNNPSLEVKNKLKKLANLNTRDNNDSLYLIDEVLYDNEPISFIVTERIGSADRPPKTLRSYMTELSLNSEVKKENVQDLRAIFFQLFFTYDIMKKIGLYHGDLHNNNILLEQKPIDAIYELSDGTKYHIKSNYTVRIFDFDNSSVIKDLSKKDARLFSITCNACLPYRAKEEYGEIGFEKARKGTMEYNIREVLFADNDWFHNKMPLGLNFLRIRNILLYGSDINKEGKFWDEIYKDGKRVIPSWEGEEIPSDFSSRLNKLISPTSEQRQSDYKIPKELGI